MDRKAVVSARIVAGMGQRQCGRIDMISKLWGPLLSATLILAACETPAQTAVPPSTAGAAGCTEFRTPIESVWERCEAVAETDASLQGNEAAKAFYHAASWRFRSGDFVEAAQLSLESLDRLRTDHPLLQASSASFRTQALADQWQAESDKFQFDRVMLLAGAFLEIAKRGGEETVAASRAGLCRDRSACLDEGLALLAEDGREIAVLDPYGRSFDTQRTSEFNRYYLLRGELNEASQTLSGRGAAISDFKAVVSSRLNDSNETMARERIEAIAIALGEEFRRNGTQARDWIQANEYFDEALAVNPTSKRALELKGESALALAEQDDANSGRYYQVATRSFETLVGIDGVNTEEKLGHYEKLGDSLLAWASSLERMPTPSLRDRERIRDLRQQAIQYYATALDLGTRNPGILQQLGDAYVATGAFVDADRAYREAVAVQLGVGNWSVPTDFGTPEGADERAFRAAMDRLSATERAAIADGVLRLYTLRQAASDVPGSGGLGDTPTELDILRTLELADNSRIEYQLDLADFYLTRGDTSSAIDRLDRILVNTTNQSDPAARAARARGLYLRSRAELSRTGTRNSQRALEWAEEAVQVDGTEPVYRTQACVADIIDGGKFRDQTESLSWCSGTSGAEGQLLQGMFYLRYAQFASGARSKLQLRDRSQFTFNVGLEALETDGVDTPIFPSFVTGQAGAVPTIETLLKYGRARAITCSGASFDSGLNRSEIEQASGIFSRYNVNGC